MDYKDLTVLLGEQDAGSDGSLKGMLERLGARVLVCEDGIEVLRRAFAKNPDLIILDVSLPKFNGFWCARILKNDRFMKNTPLILVGSSGNPIEEYWSVVSGADLYLGSPVLEKQVQEAFNLSVSRRGRRTPLIAPVNTVPYVDDYSILAMTANLLEQDLIRAKILNELHMLDVSVTPTEDLVSSTMAIIGSLYDFSLGAALILYDQHWELFFYPRVPAEASRLSEVREVILKRLKVEYGLTLDPSQIKESLIQTSVQGQGRSETEEIYIHARKRGSTRALLAFENLGFDRLRKEDQENLMLTLDFAQEVVEKKVLFQLSQELSIIDTVTEGYSLAFFMAVLAREMGVSMRRNYPISLVSIEIANYNQVERALGHVEDRDLLRLIQSLIMEVARKTDIIARFEKASFAFLLTHTGEEGARIAQDRIARYLREGLSRDLISTVELAMKTGICQFDPAKDESPEQFFARAVLMPTGQRN